MFTTTLGLHGFAHLHPFTRVHTRTHTRQHSHTDIFIALVAAGPSYIQSTTHLDGDVELGGLLGGSGRFVNGSVQIHGHGEDGGVNGSRLGQQAVLQARSDLVQPHQGIHWLVGVYGFTVQD